MMYCDGTVMVLLNFLRKVPVSLRLLEVYPPKFLKICSGT